MTTTSNDAKTLTTLNRIAATAERIAVALERANEIAEAKPKITEAEIRAASGDALLRIAEKVGLDLWAERRGYDIESMGEDWLRSHCIDALSGSPLTDPVERVSRESF